MTAKKSKKVIVVEGKFPFGAAVANFKSVSEEEVVSLAGDKILREWEKQIRIATSNIKKATVVFEESAIERDQEAKERMASYLDSFLDVDAEAVKTVDARTNFVSVYESNIAKKLARLEQHDKQVDLTTKNHEDYIENQKEIIARYEKFIGDRMLAIEKRIQ